jgi:molecular chaperone DnaJ
LGANPEIQTLSSKVKIKLEPGIQSGKLLRLRGKGLPSVESYGTGDLLIHVNVWTPQSLDKDQRKFFEANRDESNFNPDPDKNDKSFFDRVKEMFQ